ncbi:MAG: hypothetical protein HOJ35_08165 [Bdellovibrionales bacterium]|jgi:hypothetical protein|nr:hypothetical protein [Bdellovibrionales bacterium]
MAFSITGQIKVETLKKRFHDEFGLTLRVYDGRSFADEGKTIGQIRKKKGSGDLSIKKNMKVGTLEEKIEEEFGIKVQIAGSDNSYLCENDLTLASTQEKDERKLKKKGKQLKENTSHKSIGGYVSNAVDQAMGDLSNLLSSAEFEEQDESSHIIIKIKNAHLFSIGYYKIDENNEWDQGLKEEIKETMSNNGDLTDSIRVSDLTSGEIYDTGGMMIRDDCSIDIYNENGDLIESDVSLYDLKNYHYITYGDTRLDYETNFIRAVNFSNADDAEMCLDIPLNKNFNLDKLIFIRSSLEGNIKEWNGTDGIMGFAYMNEDYQYDGERDPIEIEAKFIKKYEGYSKLARLNESILDFSKANGLSFSDIKFSFDTPILNGGGRELYANIDGSDKYESSQNIF